MKVKVLGASCTWYERNNTSYLIDDDIIFDVPSGSYKYIIKNCDLLKTKVILISHFHADHFGDLHIIATRFMRELNLKPSEKLKIYGPTKILERLIQFNKVIEAADDEINKAALTKNIEFIDLCDGMEFETEKYHIKAHLMNHGRAETYGFTFTDKNGKTVGFSADTSMCENLHNILKKSNYAFVEMCRFTKGETHLSTNEVEKLIKKYNQTQIYAVHTTDETYEYAKMHEIKAVDDGEEFEF
ncbi:MAG: ribonuclease Z [Clostridia bacterium]|nr:ribonuclease Z [Clostridia bacterium]